MTAPHSGSPRTTARLAGLAYLLMFVAAALATVARRGIIVSGDAIATSANIMAHQSAYVAAFAGDVLVVAVYVVVVALFYRLFAPVSRTLAQVAAAFGIMGCAIQATSALFQLAPLTVLGGGTWLGVFSAPQLQALAYMFLKIYSQAYGVALVFFGCFCLTTGYLIYRSTFLPRVLGVLLMITGVAWLGFLSPILATKYIAVIMATSLSEVVLALWLVTKGVDEDRWRGLARPGSA
ncbi:MAG: hypothetical protein JWO05_1082 [Gemmatimonadetes bacterium]|nr:hypothetical protein [Gemmatimonadota bacterium]